MTHLFLAHRSAGKECGCWSVSLLSGRSRGKSVSDGVEYGAYEVETYRDLTY